MSKKILSMLLAVVMLFSVVAVTAFATDSAKADWVGIVLKTDAVIDQGANTKVHVNVYLQFPDGFDSTSYKHQLTKFAVTFNGAKYAFDSAVWHLTNLDGDKFIVEGNTRSIPVKQYRKIDFAATGEDIYGWTTGVFLDQVIDVDSQDLDSKNCVTGNSGYSVTIDGAGLVHMATLTLSVIDTLTANDVVGVSLASCNSEKTLLACNDGSSVYYYPASEVKVENAKPAPTKVADKTVQIKDNNDGTYSLGFVGTFCIAPEFDATTGKSAKIKALGVDVWKNGTQVGQHGDFETNYAYEDSDNGGYKFRAVFPNLTVAANGNDVITVKMYAVLEDGTTVYSNGTSTTLNDQLARVGW